MIIKKQAQKQKISQNQIEVVEQTEVATKVEPSTEPVAKPVEVEEKIDIFNLDNIDFSQRQERRRGDRRRGYRRIDDRNLISRAQEEAEMIKENAAKEGYKAGIEQAQADIAELRNAISNIVNAKKEVFEYIAPDILEISVDIATKIIKKEVKDDPEIILSTILDVMHSLSKDETKVSIRINSEQVNFVKAEMDSIVEKVGIDAKINLVADDNVEEGGCIFQTNNGIIDATINTQLEIIKEALKDI